MDFNLIVVIVAFLVSVFNLWDKVDARIKQSKEPTKALETRIENLETLTRQRFSTYDDHFDNDLRRIKSIEEGNKVMQKAMLALLKHAIDGNETEALQKASNDLQNYLIER